MAAIIHIWDTTAPPWGALAVAGSLTAGNCDELHESIEDRLPAGAPFRLLRVDCGGVAECDSTGLSTLLTLRRRAAELGAEFRLSASPALASVTERTGTSPYLGIETSPRTATTEATANRQPPIMSVR
jgi:anti-anti-sigma regulatory factor